MVQWFRFCTSTAEAQVRFLGRELRSNMLHSAAPQIFLVNFERNINENNNTVSAHHIRRKKSFIYPF